MALVNFLEKKLSKKNHGFFFYLFYVILVYLFWFLYGLHTIKDLRSGFRLFLYASPYLLAFWFNKTYLFNRLFLKNKILPYFLLTGLSFFLLNYLQQVSQVKSAGELREIYSSHTIHSFLREMTVSQITFGLFTALGISISLIETWLKNTTEIAELRSEKFKAELSSLKNQLSPHFLFNTLNMVHVLTRTNPLIASEIVLELSELMRYQLYGASRELVSIEEEINFIHNLLKIEKMRKIDLKLNFEINISSAQLPIQPLILAPLVENALKHGSQKMEVPEIDIRLTYQTPELVFRISNNCLSWEHENRDQKISTGLFNLRRRLELVYGDKSILTTSQSHDYFVAELTIIGLTG